jgi:hypothetical protein
LPEKNLAEFLDETGLELEDLYSGSRGGWVGLRRDAGLEQRLRKTPRMIGIWPLQSAAC